MGFSFWHQINNDQSVIPEFDLHFNFGCEYAKFDFNKYPFLDVGILAINVKAIKNFHFYLPIKINANNLEDLGGYLQNTEMLGAIFNRRYAATSEGQAKTIDISYDKLPVFTVYKLDIDAGDIIIEEKNGGTILSIDVDKIFQLTRKSENIYFRFRIKSKGLKKIIQSQNPSNFLLQSAISSIDYVNFRLNDVRSLDSSLLETIDGIQYARATAIRKIEFFILTSSETEMITHDSVKARGLESNVWESYIGCKTKKSLVVYQWTQENGKEDFSKAFIPFIRIKVIRCNFITIILYLIILSLITVCLNILSNTLYDKYFDNTVSAVSKEESSGNDNTVT